MCICDSRLQRIWIKEQSVLIIRLRRGKKVGYEIEQYPVAIWSPIGTGHIVMTDPAQLTKILLVDQIADFRRMFVDPLEKYAFKASVPAQSLAVESRSMTRFRDRIRVKNNAPKENH